MRIEKTKEDGGVHSQPGGGAPGASYQPQSFQPRPNAMMGGGPGGGDKKQRDVYVGNLLQDVVTPEMLSEFFTAQLAVLPGYEPTSGP
ncbi:hypothetical protein T492DRAFT_859126, partial [Pavlovales sp. CCMP2436]